MFFKKIISRQIDYYKLKTVETANITLDSVLKIILLILLLITVVWVSVFLYVVFYYTYVPSIAHVKNVNLQFTPCDTDEKIHGKAVCSFLKSHVELTKANQLFMLGQSYKITLTLELPESEPNKALGMFMVCGQLMDKKGVTVSLACRSAILKYRSRFLRYLSTLVLAPLYVFDYIEEKQIITIELYSDFQDDQNYPVTDIVIELKTTQLEVYSSKLKIDAHLSGLRYLMYNWPTFSAFVGTMLNLSVILFICTLSWWHLTGATDPEGREFLYKKFKDKLTPVLKLKKRSGFGKVEEKEIELVSLKGSSDCEDFPEEEIPKKKIVLEMSREPSSSEA